MLTVRKSEIGRALYLMLCLAAAVALCLIHARGYTALAASLVVPAAGLLWYRARDHASGLQIHWRQSSWSLVRGDSRSEIVLQPGTVCLRWVLQLRWIELSTRRRGELWLFRDSATPAELRLLRRRLVLER